MNLAGAMGAVCKKMNVTFTLKGRKLEYDEVFSGTGMLPGLVRRADQLASLCFGYTLGAKFEDTEGTLLGVKVVFDEFTPDVLRIFCLTDVVNELVKASPTQDLVSLDELSYE